MERVAILIDGGFYRKRMEHLAKRLKDVKVGSPREDVKFLMEYCRRHYVRGYKDKNNQKINPDFDCVRLYRIFYYDCRPSDKKIYHPLLKKQVDLGKTDLYIYMNQFLDELTKQRKVALRLGKLSEEQIQYNLRYEPTKKLLAGAKSISDLREEDFALSMEQKGVDMKIGVDIASLAYKKQVDKIILISGDSDFVPAAKLARREGIDFVLDPLWANIIPDLHEHIDGLQSRLKRPPDVDIN